MRIFGFRSDRMVSTENTCYLKVNGIISMQTAPSDQRIAVDPSRKKRPQGKRVRAMQAVLELTSFVRASKQARQYDILVVTIPPRSGPPIAPKLDDLDSISSPTLLQDAPALMKKDSATNIEIIRVEKKGKASCFDQPYV